MVGAVAEGLEHESGPGDINDSVGHGGQELGLGEVGHLLGDLGRTQRRGGGVELRRQRQRRLLNVNGREGISRGGRGEARADRGEMGHDIGENRVGLRV